MPSRSRRCLWLTTARELHAHTLLLDTWGTILSQFELPVAAAAVAWLDDGRRVLVTEGAARLPALWDGAGFSPLPLPPGCAQVECTPLAWSSDSDAAAAADDGTAHIAPEPVCRGVLFTLKGRTAPDAPLIVHVGAPSAPLLAPARRQRRRRPLPDARAAPAAATASSASAAAR